MNFTRLFGGALPSNRPDFIPVLSNGVIIPSYCPDVIIWQQSFLHFCRTSRWQQSDCISAALRAGSNHDCISAALPRWQQSDCISAALRAGSNGRSISATLHPPARSFRPAGSASEAAWRGRLSHFVRALAYPLPQLLSGRSAARNSSAAVPPV